MTSISCQLFWWIPANYHLLFDTYFIDSCLFIVWLWWTDFSWACFLRHGTVQRKILVEERECWTSEFVKENCKWLLVQFIIRFSFKSLGREWKKLACLSLLWKLGNVVVFFIYIELSMGIIWWKINVELYEIVCFGGKITKQK